MRSEQIGVFGATGHTGRFVAAELQRRGVDARWIGRDRQALCDLRDKLGRGDVRAAAIDDPASLRQAFDGLAAVINCAGPFLETGAAVIAAALDTGCHVLDITAEQAAVLETIASFDEAARSARRVVLPAMAFFGGLADLLVSSLIDTWPDVDTVEIAVALDSWHPTAGTRQTGARNTATRMLIRNGGLSPIPSPAPTAEWQFPDPFGRQRVACVPLSEIIIISRHVKATDITSYMTMKPLADLADAATPPPVPCDSLGRSDQMFSLSALVKRGVDKRQATVTGRDIYAVTAPLVVEASMRLIAAEAAVIAGVRAPGELFDTSSFLSALSDVLSLDRSSDPHQPSLELNG